MMEIGAKIVGVEFEIRNENGVTFKKVFTYNPCESCKKDSVCPVFDQVMPFCGGRDKN